MARPSINVGWILLFSVIYIVFVGNRFFWQKIADIVAWPSLSGLSVFLTFAVTMIAAFFLILLPITQRYLFKSIVIILFFIVALVSWFMNEYGTIINRDIIQSALETDSLEARELLTTGFFLHLAMYWLLPSILILWSQPKYSRGLSFITRTSLMMVLTASVAVLTIWIGYKDISVLGRNHSELKMFINPTYPIYATWEVIIDNAEAAPGKLIAIDKDAHSERPVLLAANHKPRIVVLVLGETARADHFQRNGYDRPTTPLMTQARVLNYTNVSSCGTATSVSVPCIFSHLGRESFNSSDASRYENLLHLLRETGTEILWRENNTGCKGVCDDFETDNFRFANDKRFCDGEGCFDEILLDDLRSRLSSQTKDLFIVLHQAGSHGPAYYRRYPKSMEFFSPVCASESPQDCSQDQLINAYDNTIRYTDYFLSKLIGILDEVSDTKQTAMIYVSDHGESLGENGIYLHGLPYTFAPEAQTHVPMLVWLSKSFIEAERIDYSCMASGENQPLSHDNIFHLVLSLFDVKTTLHIADASLIKNCSST
ncbi:MAG: phosphoethanolamine transferase [marine bacterium B5-7]|nr:MAG: phosphoethanolamine transferase [marine bacterium B5-7]